MPRRPSPRFLSAALLLLSCGDTPATEITDTSSSSESSSDSTTTGAETGTAPGTAPAEATAIYWTDKSAVLIQRAVAPDYDVETLVAPGPKLLDPRGIVIDPDSASMFWTDIDRGMVMRASMEGAAVQEFVTGLDAPADLELVGGQLYWAERDSSRIARAAVDGDGGIEVLVGPISTPYYLAVTADASRVYWSAFDAPEIYTAPLPSPSPAEVEVLVGGLDRVRDVDLDAAGEWLYWCDRDASKVQRARTDGSGEVEDLFIDDLGTPHGLALNGDELFWTDTSRSELRRGNLLELSDEVFAGQLQEPWALAIYTP
jgi:hypothetical protein